MLYNLDFVLASYNKSFYALTGYVMENFKLQELKAKSQ